MANVKTINSLMAYLRDQKSIHIEGSVHKRKLRNLGYYHGYKGYRFIKTPGSPINFTNFNQVIALNKFDMDLKTLFYPKIMFLETALKNYSLEEILKASNSSNFNDIYDKVLTDYKQYTRGSKNYNDAYKKRLSVRNKLYSTLANDFSKEKQVVKHFYNNDNQVPIWAIFETITLGDFGNILNCMDPGIRLNICNQLRINSSYNSQGNLICNIVFSLKDLRNSLAHNNVIFDCRFTNRHISNNLKFTLQNVTSITNINFNTIVDYLILIVYMLKNLDVQKSELLNFITDFESISNELHSKIDFSIYSQILNTDTRNKLSLLKQYI